MKYFLMVMLLPLFASAQILRPNLVINGDMTLDQRGSGTAAVTCDSLTVYGPDRFNCTENAATGDLTISQTSVTAGTAPYTLGLQKAAKLLATTGVTLGTAENIQISYKLEGYDFAPIAKKTATMSFWVRATKTGAACFNIRNQGVNRTFVKQYTIAAADTWQEVSIPINFGTGTASGTWNYATDNGLRIVFAGAFGTDLDDGTDGAWVSSNEQGTAACQTNNLLAATNDYVEITGVRLTEGAQKVPFVRAGGGTYAAELALAQRYFWKTFAQGTAPAQNVEIGTTLTAHSIATPAGSYSAYWSIPFPVVMRATPTITFYNPQATNANCRNFNVGDSGAAGNVNTSASLLQIRCGQNGEAVNALVMVHVTASAEL